MPTKRYQYTVTVLPEDATDKEVTWWIENITGTAEVDQTGLVTPLTIGHIKIHAALKNSPTINDNLLVLIEENEDDIDSIKQIVDFTDESKIMIYDGMLDLASGKIEAIETPTYTILIDFADTTKILVGDGRLDLTNRKMVINI